MKDKNTTDEDTIYLNGEYVNKDHAKISVLDRGFLFADGVYEVIPVYDNQVLFLYEHLERLQQNLTSIEINYKINFNYWQKVCHHLIISNGNNRPIYIQITRGTDITRLHDFDDDLTPTVVALSLDHITLGSSLAANGINVITLPDIRWKLCHIKSIALLGNILLRKKAKDLGAKEVLLINDQGYIVEGSSSNYFIVKNNKIITPPLNQEILPGITRQIIINICQENNINVYEQHLTEADLYDADEIWITSSTREIIHVNKVNNTFINNGRSGIMWQKISKLYIEHIKNILNKHNTLDNLPIS
jgi:D-alanine transaminase